jgi:RNase adapter protein RapZ
VVFLDASDEVLVRRQEAVRRPHPLQGADHLVSGIARERGLLEFIRDQAEVVIDTSSLNVTQLKMKVAQAFGGLDRSRLQVTVMSFGFKYGLPLDANFVVDMRFLPNPYWNEELRPFTGQDSAVRDFVLGQAGAEAFLRSYVEALAPVLDGYPRESKRYLAIAVGCTGGKHRSVAMSEELGRRLHASGVSVGVMHRDLGRE